MIKNVKFGADPELFFANAAGKFVSSIDKVGGSKIMPRDIGDSSAVQEDNVAVEFNTKPAATKEDFIRSLNYPLRYLKSYAEETLGLQLAIVPSAIFTADELQDERARVFGCDPDFDAWTLEQNPRPMLMPELACLRTAGGHLHVSWDNRTDEEAVDLVRALDLFVGVPSTFYDGDVQRRMLYGRAGAFRHKPYGVEYRTLSNWWITSEKYMGTVFDWANQAIEFVNEGRKIDSKTQSFIQQAINMNNSKTARALVSQFKLAL